MGQGALQGAVKAALQLRALGQGREQGIVGGGVGRRLAQRRTGGGPRSHPAGGIEEDRPQDPGARLGTRIAETDVLLDKARGVAVDVAGGQRILPVSHGSLLE